MEIPGFTELTCIQPGAPVEPFVGIGQAFMTTPSDRLSQIELTATGIPRFCSKLYFCRGHMILLDLFVLELQKHAVAVVGCFAQIHIHIEP